MAPRLESGFPSAQQSPGFLLWRAHNRLHRIHRQVLAEVGLTPAQFSILACLVDLGQEQAEVIQAHVADRTQMDKMLVSDVVKALIAKRLIIRSRSKGDARARALRATSAGLTACRRAIRDVERADGEFFSRIKDLARLIPALDALGSGD